nr:Z1 domain-containing protein [Pedobacter panaciterrae]
MGWDFLSDHIRNKVEKIKRSKGFITLEQLEDHIDEIYSKMQSSEVFEDEFEGIDDQTLKEWLTKIKLRLKSVIVTTVDPDNVIDESKDYERWIEKRPMPLNWNYFDRYLSYLKKLGRPADVIVSTEKSTKAIIERLGDPRQDIQPLQKGLVLGAVQSGKTANFNGVINRGVDAGYDMIIVFSGIMEDLRYQTQKRINNDVIGIGEVGVQINQPLGVGKIQQFGKDGIYQITSITSTSADFKKSMVKSNFNFTNQKILVCKKNVGVLTNLIYWLKSSMPEGCNTLPKSLLVVDDEADNASLNNLGHKGAEYASKVNGHMRALLNLFSRRSYLGYTATPFANILQDQHGAIECDDAWVIPYRHDGQIHQLQCSLAPGLFPDKFIYKLAAPTSYLGPKRFFSNGQEQEGDRKIPLIETIPIPAEDDNYSIDDTGLFLKKSLIDAIDCFILSIALRDSRKNVLQNLPGYNDNHTMLVHISRLIANQNAAADAIKSYVSYVTGKIMTDSLSDPSGIYERLKLQWNRFFAYKVANIRSYLPEEYNADGLDSRTWDDVSSYIPTAVKGVVVKAVNSFTGDKLTYPDGASQKYIAVGGNRLSRGFTLEGLTINYFLRDTNYYDALLQMGRWFGYRPGYIDACRLFIDFPTEEKYDFITAALTELEEQIEAMEIQKKTPKEFELRIRKHPDVLKITRTSILKNAKEVRLSFQNIVQQSVSFKIEKESVRTSYESFKLLFDELGFKPTEQKGGFYTLDADRNTLFRFLSLPATYLPQAFMKDAIVEYIDLCAELGKLTKWKIAIKRTGSASWIKEPGFELQLTMRSAPSKDEEPDYYTPLLTEQIFTASGKSMNIMTSGKDESVGLREDEIKQAEIDFRNFKKDGYIKKLGLSPAEAEVKANKTTIPGWVYRKLRQESEGLLLIYLIDQKYIFNDDELKAVAERKGIDTKFPLIGYALSFPQINNDPGALYMANEVEQKEMESETIYDGDEVPEDINNEINDIN